MSNRPIFKRTPRAIVFSALIISTMVGPLLLAYPLQAQQLPTTSSSTCRSEPEGGPPAAPAGSDSNASTNANADSNTGCATPNSAPAQKDDRIFGIVPNFATVEGAASLPPLTVGQKFKLTAKGAFDPYEFAIVGILAGANLADDKDSSYGPGWAGYGRRYAAGFADQAIGNFMTGAIFPSLLREDPRYFQLGRGGFKRRFAYALSRIVLTPRDKGGMEFNYSEFLGNATTAAISASYRDRQNQNLPNTALTFGDQILIDCLGNEMKEFWPDIHRKVFHKRHKPPEPV